MKTKIKKATKRAPAKKAAVPKLPNAKRQSLRLEPKEIQVLDELKKYLNQKTEAGAITVALMNYQRIDTERKQWFDVMQRRTASFMETLQNIQKVKKLAEVLFQTEIPNKEDAPVSSSNRNDDDEDYEEDEDDDY